MAFQKKNKNAPSKNRKFIEDDDEDEEVQSNDDEDEEEEDEDEEKEKPKSKNKNQKGMVKVATTKEIAKFTSAKELMKLINTPSQEEADEFFEAIGMSLTGVFKFPEGKTRIRIVPGLGSEKTIYATISHFLESEEEGSQNKGKSHNCARAMGNERCWYCENTDAKPSRTGFAFGFVRDSGVPVIFRLRGNALHSIKEEFKDDPSVFDLHDGYDFRITRTGSNEKTQWDAKVVKTCSPAFDNDDAMVEFYNARNMDSLKELLHVESYDEAAKKNLSSGID